MMDLTILGAMFTFAIKGHVASRKPPVLESYSNYPEEAIENGVPKADKVSKDTGRLHDAVLSKNLKSEIIIKMHEQAKLEAGGGRGKRDRRKKGKSLRTQKKRHYTLNGFRIYPEVEYKWVDDNGVIHKLNGRELGKYFDSYSMDAGTVLPWWYDDADAQGIFIDDETDIDEDTSGWNTDDDDLRADQDEKSSRTDSDDEYRRRPAGDDYGQERADDGEYEREDTEAFRPKRKVKSLNDDAKIRQLESLNHNLQAQLAAMNAKLEALANTKERNLAKEEPRKKVPVAPVVIEAEALASDSALLKLQAENAKLKKKEADRRARRAKIRNEKRKAKKEAASSASSASSASETELEDQKSSTPKLEAANGKIPVSAELTRRAVPIFDSPEMTAKTSWLLRVRGVIMVVEHELSGGKNPAHGTPGTRWVKGADGKPFSLAKKTWKLMPNCHLYCTDDAGFKHVPAWPKAEWPKNGEWVVNLRGDGRTSESLVTSAGGRAVEGSTNLAGYTASTEAGVCGSPVVSISLRHFPNALVGVHVADQLFAKFDLEWMGKNFPNV